MYSFILAEYGWAPIVVKATSNTSFERVTSSGVEDIATLRRESLYIPVEAESCEMSRESLMSASSRAIESARILSAKAIESS